MGRSVEGRFGREGARTARMGICGANAQSRKFDDRLFGAWN